MFQNRTRLGPVLAGILVMVLAVSACQPVQPVLPGISDTDAGAGPGTAPPAEDVQVQLPPAELPPIPALTPEECRGLLATVNDFVRADDYDAVVTLLDFVLDCGVSDDLKAGLLFLRAEANMQRGKWRISIGDYRDSLALGLEADDAAGARNNICWFLALDNQPEAALPYCEQAVSIDPAASYLDSRGLAHALAGNLEAAVADFEAALAEWEDSANPEIQAVYAERAGWLEALRAGENPITPQVLAKLQAEDAPALSAELASSVSEEATEHLLRGRRHHMYRQFDEALDEYSQAIELDPDYALAYFYRGLIHMWQGEWEEALADMQRVTLLDPDQAHAHHVVGLMEMRGDNYVESVAAFSAAIALLPNQAEFHADRAAAYFSLGELADALDDLETSLALNPNSPQILFMRAAVHRALDNRGAAIADLERALELGLPDDLAGQAEQALRELREGFF